MQRTTLNEWAGKSTYWISNSFSETLDAAAAAEDGAAPAEWDAVAWTLVGLLATVATAATVETASIAATVISTVTL